ncbi:MAG: hypothetical protein ACOZNI_29325 [Myxococcota bacterium]
MRVPFAAWARSTWAWLRGNPVPMMVVSCALVGGAVAGVPAGDEMYRYMWNDATFCDDCHVHDYANKAWAASVHSRLTTCHDCHRVPIRHYPKNLVVTVFDTPATPEDIPRPEVGVVICEQCHAESGAGEHLTGPMPEALRAHVPRVDESPLHRVHLDAETRTPSRYHGGGDPEVVRGAAVREHAGEAGDRIACLDCHGGENEKVHRFVATAEVCETCHEGITPQDESGRALSCLDCHGRGFVSGSASP